MNEVPTSVQTQWVVSGGGFGKHRSWTLKEAKLVEGKMFISLQRRDRKLVQYVHGKSASVGREGMLLFLEDLRAKRNSASRAKELGCEAALFSDTTKKTRSRESTIPENTVLVLELDAVVCGTLRAGPLDMHVLYDKASSACVEMEATADNLMYLRVATMAKLGAGSSRQLRRSRRGGYRDPERVDTPAGVSWDYSRERFYVRYTRGGKRCKKVFNYAKAELDPEAEQVAKAEALEKAVTFVANSIEKKDEGDKEEKEDDNDESEKKDEHDEDENVCAGSKQACSANSSESL